MNTIDIDDFTRAYLACGLTLAEDGEDEALAQVSTYDLPDETLKAAKWDCDEFRAKARAAGKGDYVEGDVTGYSEDQAAYDLWLTRNHHGAGFWDRGLEGNAGDVLTEIAHSMGEVDFYMGDDGKAHLA